MISKESNEKIFTAIGLDFETGSLNCEKGAVTQIAMQAIRLDTFELLERYRKYLYPYNKQPLGGGSKRKVLKSRFELNNVSGDETMEYEQVALDYSGITMEILLNKGIDIHQVATDILSFAERNTLTKGIQTKPILIGQNILFDIGFLQQIMNYTHLTARFEKVFSGKKDFYGNFQPYYIDTIHLARLIFANDYSVNAYKLEIIAQLLGIELDDAHDADADVSATLDIVRVCAGRLRQNNSTNPSVTFEKKDKTRLHFKI